MIQQYFDDLESRIDPAVEEALFQEWVDFLEGCFCGDLFSPRRPAKRPSSIPWPKVGINESLVDFDKMALQQYGQASSQLAEGAGTILNVRCNYGTAILPSLFGAELFLMDAELDTLPTNRPLPGGNDGVRAVLDHGEPDLSGGLGERVLEMGQRFADIGKAYPKIGRFVHLYHPDLQGPMDVCELLWGSRLFLDLVDEPNLVKDLLGLITDTYIRFLRAWHAIAPPSHGHNAHWGSLHKGRIMLRDDSAMNLSPAMYDEFVRPYDERLLAEFGGGGMHFCGRGDHYITSACAIPGLHAILMSQPQYNDMETIYRHTVDQGIPLIQFNREEAERALASGRDLHSLVQCW